MKSLRALTTVCLSFLCPLSLLHGTAPSVLGQDGPTPSKVVVKGRVACLDESGRRLGADQPCNQTSPNYELLTADGKRFHFSPDDLIVPIFTETRVRRQELQIQALRHDNRMLELEKVQAVKDGTLYDIYYFCKVCNITAYGPGPCPCCYEPMEYVEKPAN